MNLKNWAQNSNSWNVLIKIFEHFKVKNLVAKIQMFVKLLDYKNWRENSNFWNLKIREFYCRIKGNIFHQNSNICKIGIQIRLFWGHFQTECFGLSSLKTKQTRGKKPRNQVKSTHVSSNGHQCVKRRYKKNLGSSTQVCLSTEARIQTSLILGLF